MSERRTLPLAFYRALYPDSHSGDDEARMAGKRALALLREAGIEAVYVSDGETHQ